jgi:hypothetical protein
MRWRLSGPKTVFLPVNCRVVPFALAAPALRIAAPLFALTHLMVRLDWLGVHGHVPDLTLSGSGLD